jgi:pyrroline-5-carboxylate reductase
VEQEATMQFSVPGPVLLVGCGNMAGAMLHRWLAAGADPAAFTVVRPSGRQPAPGIRTSTAVPPGESPALVLLGVKPQKLDEVAPGLAPLVGPGTTLVSILAGVEIAALRARFAAAGAVVRAMPNTPVALGKGVINLLADAAAARGPVEAMMTPLGRTEWFEDEALFALAGHLTGAGPAFLYRFIDALATAGADLGLAPEQAQRLATAMVDGAGALAASSPETPAMLARRVASPGGTTEAGLRVLDSDGALQGLILRTLDASRRRSIEMAEAARLS